MANGQARQIEQGREDAQRELMAFSPGVGGTKDGTIAAARRGSLENAAGAYGRFPHAGMENGKIT